jgi:adenine-specific DNA-methyltransferase
MSEDIDSSLKKAWTELIENFDDEVREKLRGRSSAAQEYRSRFETLLMKLTRHELKDDAEFLSDYSFLLRPQKHKDDYPQETFWVPGLYELPRRSGEAHLYRLGHPLAIEIIKTARMRTLKPATIEFDLSGHEGKISIMEEYKGQSGFLNVTLLRVSALEQDEEYFLFAGITHNGKVLDDEIIKRLFTLDGVVTDETPETNKTGIAGLIDKKEKTVLERVSQRNADYFEKEADKLDSWAEDLKLGLEREIKDLDKQIKETRRLSVAALTLEEKLRHQKEIKRLESARNTSRKSLFEAQDDIDRCRNNLIEDIEAKLKAGYTRKTPFEVQWRLR